MKAKLVSFATVIVFSFTTAFAGGIKTEEFEVAGNCNMCKARIEKAANALEGVSAATWDKETKMMEVSFNPEKSSAHVIQKAIADAGHDTPMHKATQEAYDNLPSCCQYKRMSEKGAGDMSGMDHGTDMHHHQ